MIQIGLIEAVLSLSPGAEVVIRGQEIEWINPSEPTHTLEEIKIELERLKDNYASKEYQRQRALEYPDFKEYLDGIVKGDQAQIQSYIDACLAVKDKYPKPEST